MGGLFSTPKLATPTPTPAPSQSVSNTVAGLQNSTSLAAKLAGGVGSTMLTGSTGVSTSSNSANAKTLLGG